MKIQSPAAGDRPKRPLLTRLFALLLALVAAAAATPVAAQTAPSVLEKIIVLADTPGQTRLRLVLVPSAHVFTPIGNDANRPALGLALTNPGGGAVTPAGLKGLVRGISFEQVETILILRFQVAERASVTATASGERFIDVTVSAGAPPVNLRSRRRQ